MQYLVFAIVEAQRIPCGMFAPPVAIKILVVAAVKTPEPLCLVFYRVAVYNVHNHSNAKLVGFVYERLKLFRSAETA